jgi:ribosomal protein S10
MEYVLVIEQIFSLGRWLNMFRKDVQNFEIQTYSRMVVLVDSKGLTKMIMLIFLETDCLDM